MGKHKSHKRKRSSGDEEIYSLFKKLKRKMKKISSRESDSENEEEVQECVEEEQESLQNQQELSEMPPEAIAEDTTNETPDITETQPLDEEILSILGDDPNKKNYSSCIHKDITTRWNHITKNGLEKETKEELVKSYSIPENCLFLEAPKLNAEIKAAVSEQVLKRDKGMEQQQNSLGQVTACIGKALNVLIKSKETMRSEESILEATKILSDTGRMMCDLFYSESVLRRYLLQFALNKNTKDIVAQTQVGTHLFGENLHEALKAGKAINKTGSEIKYSTPNNKQGKPVALNARGPPRRYRPQHPPSVGNQYPRPYTAPQRWPAPHRGPAPQRYPAPHRRGGPAHRKM